MTADVEECFRKIIEKRNPPKAESMVDGKSGFLYFDKNGSICYSLHWEHYFQHIIQKYNNTYKVQMNVITPHVCRHTYCSNMAKSGMNPKALQYLMGHSDISVTLNTYTHWIINSGECHYKFTIEVNDRFKIFKLPYRLQSGIVIKQGYKTTFPIDKIINSNFPY